MAVGSFLTSFVNAFLAARKQLSAEAAGDSKSNYYQAMIGIRAADAKARAGQAERRLAIQERNAGTAARRAANSERVGNARIDYMEARKAAGWGSSGSRGSAAPALLPDDEGGAASATPEQAIPDAVPLADSATDAWTDVPVPAQEFADGGPVEPARALPDTGQQRAAPANPPATSATSATSASGDGERSDDGFDVRETLRRWDAAGGAADTPPAATTVNDLKSALPQGMTERLPKPNPVQFGLKELARAMPEGMTQALPVGGGQAGGGNLAQRLARNEGAASAQEVAAIDSAIDPNKQLSESARNIKRLDATVNYYLARGDAVAASKVAQSLLLYGKRMSQQYGALAHVAMQNGDTAGAIKYLQRAYDYVPDGRKLNATVKDGAVHASVTDERTGKTQDLGTFGAAEVMKLTLGVASGQEYMKHLLAVAAGPKAIKAPQQPSPAYERAAAEHGLGGMSPQEAAVIQRAQARKKGDDFETRVAPFRDALNSFEKIEDVDKATGQKVAGTSLMDMVRKSGADYETLKPQLERVGADIMGAGFRDDPRLAAEFVVNMAGYVDKSNPDALPPHVSFDPTSKTLAYKGTPIPITEQAFRQLTALRTAAMDRVKKKLATAAGKGPVMDAATHDALAAQALGTDPYSRRNYNRDFAGM